MGKIVKTAARSAQLTDPLGKNLAYLLAPSGKFENVRKLAIAMNGDKVDESQIKSLRRAMYENKSITLSTLTEITKGLRRLGYDVETWQLLVPDSNPANPRILMPINPGQRKLWEAIEEIQKHAKEEIQ